MAEYLIKLSPNTARNFFSDLMLNYGISINEFESKDLLTRYAEVRRFFGYSMTIDTSKPIEDIQSEIKSLFEDFENDLINHPEGFTDYLKVLDRMSNREKEIYTDARYKRTINMSLCYAICENKRFRRLCLSDALKPRELTAIELISSEKARKIESEQKFWSGIINDFNKEEIAPF